MLLAQDFDLWGGRPDHKRHLLGHRFSGGSDQVSKHDTDTMDPAIYVFIRQKSLAHGPSVFLLGRPCRGMFSLWNIMTKQFAIG